MTNDPYRSSAPLTWFKLGESFFRSSSLSAVQSFSYGRGLTEGTYTIYIVINGTVLSYNSVHPEELRTFREALGLEPSSEDPVLMGARREGFRQAAERACRMLRERAQSMYGHDPAWNRKAQALEESRKEISEALNEAHEELLRYTYAEGYKEGRIVRDWRASLKDESL